jgi:hypothetical protein
MILLAPNLKTRAIALQLSVLGSEQAVVRPFETKSTQYVESLNRSQQCQGRNSMRG